jgi:hypothetical protein
MPAGDLLNIQWCGNSRMQLRWKGEDCAWVYESSDSSQGDLRAISPSAVQVLTCGLGRALQGVKGLPAEMNRYFSLAFLQSHWTWWGV